MTIYDQTRAALLAVLGRDEDGEKWRAAEAEGHTATFSEDGYGLQHPPSCRPNLIGCRFNIYLAAQDGPDMDPGEYRMTWNDEWDAPDYRLTATDSTEPGL